MLSSALGPVDKVWQPNPDCGQVQEAHEGDYGFVEASGDPTRLLQSVEHAFDSIAVAIGIIVAGRWILAVGLRRDHRQDAVDQQVLAKTVTIIPLVAHEQLRFVDGQGQKSQSFIVVRGLAAGQEKAKRASLTVCAGMDFCRKAAA
jgi:hypothetical protein